MIRVTALGLGVIQAILTARLLGPGGYGAIAYVMSLSMIFAALALFGTEMLAVREVAKLRARHEIAAFLGFLRAIRILIAPLLIIGVIIASLILPHLNETTAFQSVALYAALIFPLFTLTMQNQGVLRGLGHTALSQIPFQILRPIILVCVLVACFLLGLDIEPSVYLSTVIVGSGAALALSWIALIRLRPKSADPRPTPPLPALARQSAPFFAISILGLIMGEISTLMLAWRGTPEETGLFQPIARIAPLVLIGAQAASVRYASRISELWSNGHTEQVKRITRLYTLATTVIAAGLAACIFLFGEHLLGIFGEAFKTGAIALSIVAAAQVFNAACGPVGMLLTMTDRAVMTIRPKAIALGATLLTGYATIPDWGVLGAAMAMGLGAVIWNALTLLLVWRQLNFDPSIVGVFLTRDAN